MPDAEVARTQPLETLQTLQVADFDLRDVFDVPGPGNYQFQIRFAKQGAFDGMATWPIVLQLTGTRRKGS
jgi:hypothetical protein